MPICVNLQFARDCGVPAMTQRDCDLLQALTKLTSWRESVVPAGRALAQLLGVDPWDFALTLNSPWGLRDETGVCLCAGDKVHATGSLFLPTAANCERWRGVKAGEAGVVTLTV